MKKLLILTILLTTWISVKGQTEKEINDQVQFWTSINSTWRFTDHWGAMGDFHIRRDDFIKDPNFYTPCTQAHLVSFLGTADQIKQEYNRQRQMSSHLELT